MTLNEVFHKVRKGSYKLRQVRSEAFYMGNDVRCINTL